MAQPDRQLHPPGAAFLIDTGIAAASTGAIYVADTSNNSIRQGLFSSPPLFTRIIGLLGSLAFGSVQAGQSASQTLTITNSGGSPLTVSSINYPPGFSGAWSGSVPPGGSVQVTVTFLPALATNYSGTLTVTSDATGGISAIAVSGVGIAAPTRILGLAGDLAFGLVSVGQHSTASLTLTNSGNSTLTISNISYPPGFSGAWSGSIVAGGGQIVGVTFAPAAPVSYAGNLSVSSDATAGTSSLAISGMGFVAAGPQLTGMSWSNGVSRFTLNGPFGSDYVIQISSDLVSWAPFSTNTIPAEGLISIVDPSASGAPLRFYRADPLTTTNTTLVPTGAWSATNGTISWPMMVADNYIIETNILNNGGFQGSAVYSFIVASNSNYILHAVAMPPSDGAKSFWVNIDSTPVGDPAATNMIWDMFPNGINYFTNYTVSWRGPNGSFPTSQNNDQYQPKVWYLTAGAHTLYVIGRESGTALQTISVLPYP